MRHEIRAAKIWKGKEQRREKGAEERKQEGVRVRLLVRGSKSEEEAGEEGGRKRTNEGGVGDLKLEIQL